MTGDVDEKNDVWYRENDLNWFADDLLNKRTR